MIGSEYFDVYLSTGNTFTQLKFTDCELNGRTSLYWWNPQDNKGNGAWQAVSEETAPSGSPPCITATITATTTPDLAQMEGTVFAVVPPAAPAVVTGKASSVAQASATLHATVNPNGGRIIKCEFEYGTSTAYGSNVPCSSSPGSGSSPAAVSASLMRLTANTSYHFRISATNARDQPRLRRSVHDAANRSHQPSSTRK